MPREDRLLTPARESLFTPPRWIRHFTSGVEVPVLLPAKKTELWTNSLDAVWTGLLINTSAPVVDNANL